MLLLLRAKIFKFQRCRKENAMGKVKKKERRNEGMKEERKEILRRRNAL